MVGRLVLGSSGLAKVKFLHINLALALAVPLHLATLLSPMACLVAVAAINLMSLAYAT
jgi:hypothetical protein